MANARPRRGRRAIDASDLRGIGKDIKREARALKGRVVEQMAAEGVRLKAESIAATPVRTGLLRASLDYVVIPKAKYIDLVLKGLYYARWVNQPGSIPLGHPLASSREHARDRDDGRDNLAKTVPDLLQNAAIGFPPGARR